MNKEKILKLFKNFVGEEVNIFGLQCIPVGIGEYGSDGSWDPNPASPIHFEIAKKFFFLISINFLSWPGVHF